MLLLDEIATIQQYMTLAITASVLSGIVFGFTPKGFPTVLALYNFLSRNFFHKALYGEISRIDKRIDKLEPPEITG